MDGPTYCTSILDDEICNKNQFTYKLLQCFNYFIWQILSNKKLQFGFGAEE